MNVDEDGRRVFDGVHIHIAGGRRGEFNSRYAQPGVIGAAPATPRRTARTRCSIASVRSAEPKVIATNSAAEYWRGDAWLAHGDGLTRTDVEDAPDVRHYLLAGVDHLGELGALMLGPVPMVNPPNGLSAAAPERALFVALEQWVRDGNDSAAESRAAPRRRHRGRPCRRARPVRRAGAMCRPRRLTPCRSGATRRRWRS